mgnify:FL=1
MRTVSEIHDYRLDNTCICVYIPPYTHRRNTHFYASFVSFLHAFLRVFMFLYAYCGGTRLKT